MHPACLLTDQERHGTPNRPSCRRWGKWSLVETAEELTWFDEDSFTKEDCQIFGLD